MGSFCLMVLFSHPPLADGQVSTQHSGAAAGQARPGAQAQVGSPGKSASALTVAARLCFALGVRTKTKAGAVRGAEPASPPLEQSGCWNLLSPP
ncbi:hypothetical protein D623_10006655 [Myotis brandtii]|uniref:Secreted protein n=1 Tax=Myotis brandtii TaxID=109478 RepID=S7P309_MYOBR|nr:hypothetical protein D623_10006655 [Myotis brandtii]